jgi:hypothetical protein
MAHGTKRAFNAVNARIGMSKESLAEDAYCRVRSIAL